MEIKKAPSADLEREKGLSLLLGLIVALSIFFVSIEWNSQIQTMNLGDTKLNIEDMEDVMNIEDEQPEEETPPPPAVQQTAPEAVLPQDFKVVDNNKEVAKMTFVSADQTDKPLPPPLPPGPAVVEPEETEEIFTIVEENAEFPGGMNELNKYLSKNIEYPQVAADNGIQGRVVLTFVVERDGSTSDIKVMKSVDPALDKEAIRVVKNMPKWKPGKQRNKPVRSRFNLPVVFKLQQ